MGGGRRRVRPTSARGARVGGGGGGGGGGAPVDVRESAPRITPPAYVHAMIVVPLSTPPLDAPDVSVSMCCEQRARGLEIGDLGT